MHCIAGGTVLVGERELPTYGTTGGMWAVRGLVLCLVTADGEPLRRVFPAFGVLLPQNRPGTDVQRDYFR